MLYTHASSTDLPSERWQNTPRVSTPSPHGEPPSGKQLDHAVERHSYVKHVEFSTQFCTCVEINEAILSRFFSNQL